MRTKEFDAVELTRQIRDKMYEETKNLGPEELLGYFKARSESARRKIHDRERERVLGGSA